MKSLKKGRLSCKILMKNLFKNNLKIYLSSMLIAE